MSKEVEVIEPIKQSKESQKKYNVAVYARVSTASVEQNESFENQKKYYEDMITKRPDYNFVGIFADEAISGTTDRRPDFQKMIKLAEQGYIDIIYTKSISRFSRNVADLLSYCERLRNQQVNVIFEENSLDILSPQGSLMITMLGAVAQMEVENTSAHVNWTLHNKMKAGEYVGQANPLGYDIVDNKLVVNEEEAEIVKYIFKRYLDGIGAHRIGKELENMGAKTKRNGTVWHNSTIMGIIKNEKYTGELLQGKTVTINPIGHIRKQNNNLSKKYSTENEHEAIITLDDWNKAQKMVDDRCDASVDGRRRGTTQNTSQSIFTSKLVCGYCGKNYVRRTTHPGTKHQKIIWQCATYARRGKENCPECKTVDEEYVIQSIVGIIQNLIKESDSMFYLSYNKVDTLLKDNSKNKDKFKEQIVQLNKNIALKNKKRIKLLDIYLEEEITEEEFSGRIEALDKEIELLNKALDELTSLIKHEEEVKSTNKQIFNLINEGKAEGFNKELFELLINKITIGGKRLDGVNDPKLFRYELNTSNLNTDMSCNILDGKLHYFSKFDEESHQESLNNGVYSHDSDDTRGDRGSFVPTKT